MHIKMQAALGAIAMLCSGCLTNYYEEYYIDTEGDNKVNSTHGAAPVQLRTATTEDDVINLIEDGYVSIGYSTFTAPYTAMSLAIDTAVNHGAALALLDIRFKEAKQSTSVIFLPSTSTSYSHGYVYGYGSYSGTTTTTTMNAVPVQSSKNIYQHDAMFFKKIDTSKMYGAQWSVPKRLPTEKSDSPITVRIFAVIHGSQAERDGLKRGQIVKSINGRPIETRRDIEPFLNRYTKITKVEVEDAQ